MRARAVQPRRILRSAAPLMERFWIIHRRLGGERRQCVPFDP